MYRSEASTGATKIDFISYRKPMFRPIVPPVSNPTRRNYQRGHNMSGPIKISSDANESFSGPAKLDKRLLFARFMRHSGRVTAGRNLV